MKRPPFIHSVIEGNRAALENKLLSSLFNGNFDNQTAELLKPRGRNHLRPVSKTPQPETE